MSEELSALRKKVEALQSELENYREREQLNREVDDALEKAVRERLPLRHTLRAVLPLLVKQTGALNAFVRTYDEELELRDFVYDESSRSFPVPIGEVCQATQSKESWVRLEDGQTMIAQHLDVAGELFGTAGLHFEHTLPKPQLQRMQALLETWCEEFDNYLASIALARKMHHITLETSRALKEPVLDQGINKALQVLRDNVAFDDMLLVFRQEDDQKGVSLNYKIIQNSVETHDSSIRKDMEVDEFVRNHAATMITGESTQLLDRFGITRFREEVMINGVRDERVVGRVILTSSKGEFNTFERDLVERFADFLRQRIVDFNREWKSLSLFFPPEIVKRLLQEEDYERRFLSPVEHDVAILFCDISGFTRLSEQVLKEPALIGALIDTWGERVVDIIWRSGGVFDKMVGDCVIGLWGPPFFEASPQERCRSAMRAAKEIRDYTRALGAEAGFPQLEGMEPPVGVATGLNFCPLYVGQFGPNEDYTGFSSGMNNTARLQGVAERDEILCMDGFVKVHGESELFGEERHAKVKNVAEPLSYRALKA